MQKIIYKDSRDLLSISAVNQGLKLFSSFWKVSIFLTRFKNTKCEVAWPINRPINLRTLSTETIVPGKRDSLPLSTCRKGILKSVPGKYPFDTSQPKKLNVANWSGKSDTMFDRKLKRTNGWCALDPGTCVVYASQKTTSANRVNKEIIILKLLTVATDKARHVG